MYEDIIDKILKSFDDGILDAKYPKFSGQGYRAYKIDAKNFHQINRFSSDKRIAFIDGGNAELLGGANFSLSIIRVCYLVYQNNRKIAAKKFEFLALIQAHNENNEIWYKVSFFKTRNSIDLEETSFSSFDPTLMFGINRAEINSVTNAIRRFAELKLAKIIADNKISDVIVLDGNLQSTLTNENKYLDELYESCGKNSVVLAALSKTNSLFADNGSLLSVVLERISKLQSWFYYPIANIENSSHRAEIFFVKLHEKSNHVFRFEIFNVQKPEAEEIINALASNCMDPIFIGYPYGLIEADRLARVSNQEKEALKTMFLVRLRSRDAEKCLSSANAHEILDKISF